MSQKQNSQLVLYRRFCKLFEHTKINYFEKGHILQNFSSQFLEDNNLNSFEKSEEDAFMHPTELRIYKNTIFDGYFQDYKQIDIAFLYMLNIRWKQVDSNVAFLHIRGGDYILKSLHCIPLDDLQNYIKKSILTFPKDTCFMIFTNDFNFCKSKVQISSLFNELNYSFCFSKFEDEEDDFYNMASCPRGGILANSSFSWWAACVSHFIGNESKDKKFCAPSKWIFDSRYNESGLYAPFLTVI